MEIIRKYCDDCDKEVTLTEDGYCKVCGKHADNMKSEKWKYYSPYNYKELLDLEKNINEKT